MHLPAYSANVPARRPIDEAPPADPAYLSGRRVLIVDDQPAMLEHLKLILEEHGACVATASTAAEALQLLKANPGAMQLLISDLGLPGLDGYQLIREIRTGLQLGPTDLPALALTAFARDEDRTRALGQGYQAYLTKPYAVGQLVATLRTVVAS